MIEKEFYHVWPSDITQESMEYKSCSSKPLLYEGMISNCGYDFAGNTLKFLLPNIVGSEILEVNPPNKNWTSEAILLKFSQKEFMNETIWQFSGLDEFGYVLFPKTCKSLKNNCKVHVILHGCYQNYQMANLDLVMHSGFAEYAVTNDLILLFPQANMGVENYNGCFDYGVQWSSDKLYATK